MNPAEKKAYLAKTSYKDYLLKNVKVDPGVIPFYQTSMSGFMEWALTRFRREIWPGLVICQGLRALESRITDGPGMGFEITRRDDEPYIYHFPDGIGSVPRLLVRALIPGIAPGNTMEDVVLAKFDYTKLDDNSSPTRIRLNSTAVHVKNTGNAANSDGVEVTYVRGGKACIAQANHCILACWNMMNPYLCPELPAAQKEGLAYNVKVPPGLHECANTQLDCF